MTKSPTDIARLPLAPGTLLQKGAYRIEKLLGSGGFALTYLAYQGRWEFPVCIKEYFPVRCKRRPEGIGPTRAAFTATMMGGLQAFRDEAEALSRFNHPGIVRVLGTFQENRTTYIVQEFLDGMTLSDGLIMAGKADQELVLKIAQQVGQALIWVHAAGLVHSDLKPENLFLTGDGRYVLLDFGLTRGFLSSASARKGGRGLSPGYCPPEQYATSRRLTPATDVYSFAATLYSLLTGLVPPEAPQRQKGVPLPDLLEINPGVSPKVEDALLRALELNPARRTQEVREFLHHLGLDSTPKAIAYRPPTLIQSEERLAHAPGVSALQLHVPSGRLFSGGKDGRIRAWSWPALERLATFQTGSEVTCVDVSPDGAAVALGTAAGEVWLLPSDLSGQGLLLDSGGSPLTALRFGKDRIAIARGDGSCCLLQPGSPDRPSWIAHAGGTLCLAFSPDGSFLASGGQDHRVRFWELPEPQAFCELRGHRGPVHDISFSADGTNLLSSSSDKSLIFWDLMSNTPVRELKGNQALVQFGRFSNPDQAASVGGDRQLRIYHLASGQVAYQAELLGEGLHCLAVASQQGRLVSGGPDGLLRLWEDGSAPAPAPVPAAPAPAGQRVDPLLGLSVEDYKLEQRLDRGGRAAVYRAGCRTRSVAIKVFLPQVDGPELHARLERQQAQDASLRHPNIVSIASWGQLENLTYQICELVEGWSLGRYIPDEGLTFAEGREYLQDVVAALRHAAGLGIRHGGLSLQKVLVTARGTARVSDFDAGEEPDGPALRELFFLVLTGRSRAEWELMSASHRRLRLSELCRDFPEQLDELLDEVAQQSEPDYAALHEVLQAEPETVEFPDLLFSS